MVDFKNQTLHYYLLRKVNCYEIKKSYTEYTKIYEGKEYSENKDRYRDFIRNEIGNISNENVSTLY